VVGMGGNARLPLLLLLLLLRPFSSLGDEQVASAAESATGGEEEAIKKAEPGLEPAPSPRAHHYESAEQDRRARHPLGFVVSRRVQDALDDPTQCVIALESTVISHGLPFPRNIQTAAAMEKTVEIGGCVPATIFILGGKVHVGLPDDGVDEGLGRDEVLAILGNGSFPIRKVSRRDLALVRLNREHGATTVAATMWVAAQVSSSPSATLKNGRRHIDVFATGGIGGVHREGEATMDVSADLRELGRTPVAVVCAGVKQILDIGRTLEYLETEGVPVVTIGQDTFPAFYSADSSFPSPNVAQSAEVVAGMVLEQKRLGLSAGMVIGNPVPADAGIPAAEIEAHIEVALQDAREQRVVGKAVTPFLLARVSELTAGRSLETNIALLLHNAAVASRIARHLTDLENRDLGEAMQAGGLEEPAVPAVAAHGDESYVNGCDGGDPLPGSMIRVAIFGGATLDTIAQAGVPIRTSSSVPGTVAQTFGGVGRNIAEAAARMASENMQVSFISVVGGDSVGGELIKGLQSVGVNTEGVDVCSKCTTASFVGLLDPRGDLHSAVVDMDIMNRLGDGIREPRVLRRFNGLTSLAIDANLDSATLSHLFSHARDQGSRTLFEPTSAEKSVHGVEAILKRAVDVAKPNELELAAMANRIRATQHGGDGTEDAEADIWCNAALVVNSVGFLFRAVTAEKFFLSFQTLKCLLLT
jgi:pseudouridylate synthase / pseudouridine kinase